MVLNFTAVRRKHKASVGAFFARFTFAEKDFLSGGGGGHFGVITFSLVSKTIKAFFWPLFGDVLLSSVGIPLYVSFPTAEANRKKTHKCKRRLPSERQHTWLERSTRLVKGVKITHFLPPGLS